MTEKFAVCYMRDPMHENDLDALGVMFVDADNILEALNIAAQVIPPVSAEEGGPYMIATPMEKVKHLIKVSSEKELKDTPRGMIRADKLSKKELAKILDQVAQGKRDNGRIETANIIQEAAKRLRGRK